MSMKILKCYTKKLDVFISVQSDKFMRAWKLMGSRKNRKFYFVLETTVRYPRGLTKTS